MASIRRPPRQRLVHRREVDVEAVPGGAQVKAPDPQALGAGESLGLLEVLVQVGDPLPQGPRVIVLEALDVGRLQAR
jgi:hypothetical protein